jgi:hypothetical protein
MTSTTINRGNIATTIVMTTSITPAGVATNTSAEQSFTVPGLQIGDQVSALQYQGAWTVLCDIVNLRVSGANTLSVSFQNTTGSTVTPPAGTYLLEVNRPEQVTLPTNAY